MAQNNPNNKPPTPAPITFYQPPSFQLKFGSSTLHPIQYRQEYQPTTAPPLSYLPPQQQHPVRAPPAGHEPRLQREPRPNAHILPSALPPTTAEPPYASTTSRKGYRHKASSSSSIARSEKAHQPQHTLKTIAPEGRCTVGRLPTASIRTAGCAPPEESTRHQAHPTQLQSRAVASSLDVSRSARSTQLRITSPDAQAPSHPATRPSPLDGRPARPPQLSEVAKDVPSEGPLNLHPSIAASSAKHSISQPHSSPHGTHLELPARSSTPPPARRAESPQLQYSPTSTSPPRQPTISSIRTSTSRDADRQIENGQQQMKDIIRACRRMKAREIELERLLKDEAAKHETVLRAQVHKHKRQGSQLPTPDPKRVNSRGHGLGGGMNLSE